MEEINKNLFVETKQPKYKKKQTEEEKKAYFKQYYQQHKEKYEASSEKRKDVFVDCELCQCSVKKQVISQHKRTKKHISNMANLPVNQ